MQRLRAITRRPAAGQDIAPEVKLTLVRDLAAVAGGLETFEAAVTAVIPLFINKDPGNPAPDGGG